MVEVHVKMIKEIHLAGKGKQFQRELLDTVVKQGKTLIEKNTPKKSTKAYNSYKIIPGENSREIRNDTYYLPWVNDGTGLYGPLHRRITPRHAKVLHFHWRGKEWFLKSVRGQKGKHFVERSVTEIVRSIPSASVIAANKTLR